MNAHANGNGHANGKGAGNGSAPLVFVTVGTDHHRFERLMEIVNEDLVASRITTTGHAVRKAKRRYVLEELRIDEYDRKTVMQWTTFGLPMYAVRTSSLISGATEVKGGIEIRTRLG